MNVLNCSICLSEGMIVVALKSKAEIGSPKYRILLRLALLPDVILLGKSGYIFHLYRHLSHLISHHLNTQ